MKVVQGGNGAIGQNPFGVTVYTDPEVIKNLTPGPGKNSSGSMSARTASSRDPREITAELRKKPGGGVISL